MWTKEGQRIIRTWTQLGKEVSWVLDGQHGDAEPDSLLHVSMILSEKLTSCVMGREKLRVRETLFGKE